MGWGLLVGSRLCSWHNTGQKLLLLRKIPKLRTATVGCGCIPLIWPGLWLTSALSQLQQLLIIFVFPLSSTRLSVKEREELPVLQCQWTWQGWGAQPWEGTGFWSDCVLSEHCAWREAVQGLGRSTAWLLIRASWEVLLCLTLGSTCLCKAILLPLR